MNLVPLEACGNDKAFINLISNCWALVVCAVLVYTNILAWHYESMHPRCASR